jgi:hypothetical protein
MMTAQSGETQPTRKWVCQGWRTLSFCNRHTRKHASYQRITESRHRRNTTSLKEFTQRWPRRDTIGVSRSVDNLITVRKLLTTSGQHRVVGHPCKSSALPQRHTAAVILVTESSHTTGHQRLRSGRPDISLWWRRTAAAERTGAATGEALGWMTGHPGQALIGPGQHV